jgi:hypothetical protein
MSTPAAPRKVNMPPEALASLNAVSDTPIKKPLSAKTINVIHNRVAETLYGPLMKPTFKQQLLGFPSYRAMTAVWAASYWQRQQALKEAR